MHLVSPTSQTSFDGPCVLWVQYYISLHVYPVKAAEPLHSQGRPLPGGKLTFTKGIFLSRPAAPQHRERSAESCQRELWLGATDVTSVSLPQEPCCPTPASPCTLALPFHLLSALPPSSLCSCFLFLPGLPFPLCNPACIEICYVPMKTTLEACPVLLVWTVFGLWRGHQGPWAFWCGAENFPQWSCL